MNKKGFTLIEILIVIAIIGLLASVILVGMGSFRSRGRDARRISDLRQVQNALELYFTKNGFYPDTPVDWAALTTTLIGAGIGVNAISNDPTKDWNYGYCPGLASNYVLAAYLEDLGNPSLQDNPADTNFPCNPIVSGPAGANPDCSKKGTVTNKFCLIF